MIIFKKNNKEIKIGSPPPKLDQELEKIFKAQDERRKKKFKEQNKRK